MARPITILGGGAWGTAIAHLVASKGHDVLVWCFESDVVDDINKNHQNSYYLSGVSLPNSIRATNSLSEALSYSTIIFEAIPVMFLRTILEQAKRHITKEYVWIVLSKGIENDTHRLPDQIIDDVFGYSCRTAILGGPSFARELAAQKITGVE